MAEIKVDNKEAIQTLREIVKSEELFPYADYSSTDEEIYITINIYRKDNERGGLKFSSREYDEEHDGRLSLPLRTALFQELWKFNPDVDLIRKLESLGISLKFPSNRTGWFSK
jgi:hypothetical protein